MNNNYNIERFIQAQKQVYNTVIQELKNGKKESHWIWFIFPQVKELGYSSTSKYYGIENKEEAIEYFNNDLLRQRYLECCEILLNLNNNDIVDILGDIDTIKLKSSLTLFYLISNNKIIKEVLNKYYNNNFCLKTISIINNN